MNPFLFFRSMHLDDKSMNLFFYNNTHFLLFSAAITLWLEAFKIFAASLTQYCLINPFW